MSKMWILVTEVMLGYCSYYDIKYKLIDLRILIAYVIVGMIITRSINVYGMIPGLLFLFYSKVSKEKLGEGDSLTFIAIGMFMMIYEIMAVILLSFAFAGIFVAFYVFIINREKLLKTNIHHISIPFAVFICIGFNLLLLRGY